MGITEADQITISTAYRTIVRELEIVDNKLTDDQSNHLTKILTQLSFALRDCDLLKGLEGE